MKMTPWAMVAKLKEMGLPQTDRSKVLETFRDAGEKEALEQANEILQRRAKQIAAAEKAMNSIMGR